MGDDRFERFSDSGTSSSGRRPAPGASLQSTILVEDNLIVGAALMSPAQNAVAVAKAVSPAVGASPGYLVAGPPEQPAVTSPQGAAVPSAETASPIQNEPRSRLEPNFEKDEVNRCARANVGSVSSAVGASPKGTVAGTPEQQTVASQQAAAAQSAKIADAVQNERRSQRWPSFGRSEVNKVTWTQVGSVAEPGRYMFRFGWISITAEDLAVWRQFPNASFTLYHTAQATGEGEYRLGAFDLGAPNAR